MGKPKIVSWDVEISGITVNTWNLYPERIPYQNIIQDWYLVSVCWKELDKKTVHKSSLLDDPKRFAKDHTDDYHVVKTVRQALEDVDILIAHNAKFDLKAFNTRLIFHNLPPLPKILQVDTLGEIKKVSKFTSNRLDYLSKILTNTEKQKTSDNLWFRVCKGEVKAIKEMVRYNVKDVLILEKLYLRIRKYISHPVISGANELSCPKCGSFNFTKHKPRLTASGSKYQQYQCKCGSYFQDRKLISKPMSK